MPPPFLLLNRSDVASPLPGEVPHPVVIAGRPVPIPVADATAQRTLNTNLLYLRNPAIGGIRPILYRRPRAGLTLPTLVSLVPVPTDATLFQEPQNAALVHYLPKYAIATFGPAQQRSVSLAPANGTFVLTVQIRDVTDPSVSAHATPVVPTLTRYFLAANVGGKVATWDFAVTTAPDASIVLTTSVPDRDACNVLYRAMTDPAAAGVLTIRRSAEIAVQYVGEVDNWHEGPTAIDSTIPFAFSTTLEASVFAGVTGPAAGTPAWTVYEFNWNGRAYPYYQSSLQPAQLYFLPDAFKIFRASKAPYAPSIRVTPSGDDANSMTFGLTFEAKPVWDGERVAAAAASLAKSNGLLAMQAPALFEASATALTLTLPSTDPAQPPVATVAQNATIDMQAGLTCTLALSMQQFQQVYAALFETVSQLLSGIVTVTVGTDVQKIPLIASASDFAGDVFSIQSSFDPATSRYTIALSNAIESPIHVDALPISLMRNGVAIATQSENIVPGLPVNLAAGTGTVACVMQLAPGTAIDSATAAVIDYSRVVVKPDPSALWEAILSNQVVAPLKRAITVNAFASSFGQTSPALQALQVVFKGQAGKTVDFDAATHAVNGEMTQTVDLTVPLKAYVLQTADTSTYAYRIVEITNPPSPATPDDAATWITSDLDTIYVQTGVTA